MARERISAYSEPFVFDWSQFAPRQGLVCLPAIAMIILGSVLMKHTGVATLAGGGAVSVGFGSFQHIKNSRLWPMLLASVGMFLSTLVGAMRFSALLFTTVCAQTVRAQQSVTSQPADWLDRDTLTGNWAGVRTTLQRAGIELRTGFTTESAANPVGGQKQTARYTQQVDFGADLDLSRLVGDPGAKIQITFTDRVGRSLCADAIGNLFAVQQLYGAGQNFRIVELNYQQSLFADKLNFELGWSPAGDFFASLPVFCDFQNGFICGHPSPLASDSGAQNYPIGQWGARVRMNPTQQFYIQTGLYQVNPNERDSTKVWTSPLAALAYWFPSNSRGCPDKERESSPAFIRSAPAEDFERGQPRRGGLRSRHGGAKQTTRSRYWLYENDASIIDGDGLKCRALSWIVWKLGVDTWNIWEMDFKSPRAWLDPETYRPANGKPHNGAGILVYRGETMGLDEPPASIRLKGMRRGSQDYEYFGLLAQAPGGREVVDDAVRHVVQGSFQREESLGAPGMWIHDPDEWDRVRVRIGDAIVKMPASPAQSIQVTRCTCVWWAPVLGEFLPSRAGVSTQQTVYSPRPGLSWWRVPGGWWIPYSGSVLLQDRIGAKPGHYRL